ncbi:putative mitochondrial protein AtMg00310 [Apium graveolens]|uniref:putative mitochondrial protein AtMg00310 n=1 Tax=Apium graveolens TaxID=4045 RepID=UPI003D79EC90
MAWDRLCKPKSHGGLGVRSIKNFNLAMLAKQGWRNLNESNPLFSAIIKANYFPNTDFLNAQLGSNPSYILRSIMSAQEAVKRITRRKIGDGMTTNVWGVQWLTDDTNGCLTTSMPY